MLVIVIIQIYNIFIIEFFIVQLQKKIVYLNFEKVERPVCAFKIAYEVQNL